MKLPLRNRLSCLVCGQLFARPAQLPPHVPATRCPACTAHAEVEQGEYVGRQRERMLRGLDVDLGAHHVLSPLLCDVPAPRVRKPGEPGWAREEASR